eukprot:scaffold53435_cov72-Phaeocystis_antarctica.AAC.1
MLCSTAAAAAGVGRVPRRVRSRGGGGGAVRGRRSRGAVRSPAADADTAADRRRAVRRARQDGARLARGARTGARAIHGILLAPHTAAAHEALAEVRLLSFDSDPMADAAIGDGKARGRGK